jgi:hypothetical protein
VGDGPSCLLLLRLLPLLLLLLLLPVLALRALLMRGTRATRPCQAPSGLGQNTAALTECCGGDILGGRQHPALALCKHPSNATPPEGCPKVALAGSHVLVGSTEQKPMHLKQPMTTEPGPLAGALAGRRAAGSLPAASAARRASAPALTILNSAGIAAENPGKEKMLRSHCVHTQSGIPGPGGHPWAAQHGPPAASPRPLLAHHEARLRGPARTKRAAAAAAATAAATAMKGNSSGAAHRLLPVVRRNTGAARARPPQRKP